VCSDLGDHRIDITVDIPGDLRTRSEECIQAGAHPTKGFKDYDAVPPDLTDLDSGKWGSNNTS
jgi:hypothetical protein